MLSLSALNGKKFLVLDVETTNHNGNPSAFDPENRILFVGCIWINGFLLWDIEFTQEPYRTKLDAIQRCIDSCDVLVGFNIKFDLHWLRRYGIKYDHKDIWDLQYAEYCFNGQAWKMPSCEDSCQRRGLKGKLPFDHSIDHSEEEWTDYLQQDLVCEWELLGAQLRDLERQNDLTPLIWWGSQDIKITAEMEYNGILYDHEKSYQIGDTLLLDVALIDSQLYELAPWPQFNWASPEHVSAILYGGEFKYETSEPFIFTYKDGRTVTKMRKVVKKHVLPKLVEPLKGTKGKKEGYFSTGEGILHKLKAIGTAKQIVTLLLKRRGLEKKVGTYYHGIPKIAEESGWQDGLIHGQLNHCVAATGRLSSNKPNLQNLEAQMRQCVKSRFPLTKLTKFS